MKVKSISIVEGHDLADTIHLILEIPEVNTATPRVDEVAVFFRVPVGTASEWWQTHLPDLPATFINPVREVKNLY